jgi:hypothetical protein
MEHNDAIARVMLCNPQSMRSGIVDGIVDECMTNEMKQIDFDLKKKKKKKFICIQNKIIQEYAMNIKYTCYMSSMLFIIRA